MTLHLESLLSRSSKVVVAASLIIWLTLDVMLIYLIATDDHPMLALRYLTNQVWLIGIIPKALLWVMLTLAVVYHDQLETYLWRLLVLLTLVSFLIFGVLQAGVLITFFVLLCFDSSMFQAMVMAQDHNLATVVLWNHIRHVTPVFLHLIVLYAMKDVTSSVLEPLKIKHVLSFGICICAVVLGVTHLFVSCDSKLYMYEHGNDTIDTNCRIVFMTTTLFAISYFVYAVL